MRRRRLSGGGGAEEGGLGRVRFCLLGGKLGAKVLDRPGSGCSSGGCAGVLGGWLKLCACDKDLRARFFVWTATAAASALAVAAAATSAAAAAYHGPRRQVGEPFV